MAVTHFMDGSFVYGSTNEVAARLREGQGGLMRVDVRDGRPWPPAAVNKSAACDTQTEDEPCYQFGMNTILITTDFINPLGTQWLKMTSIKVCTVIAGLD